MDSIFVSHICKSFDGKKVLDHFSAEIPKEAVTCIMAPSGGGKTTLLRILMGLTPPDEGVISGMAGLKISVVFQEDRLMENLDASGNIRLVSPKLSSKKIQTELENLGLWGCTGQPVSEFSGGMRRRVSLLRALLADYDILFLDEPFKGLDSDTRSKVISYTREHCLGRTVVLVTHDPSEADDMNAARILTL